MTEFISHSVEETERFAEHLAKLLRAGDVIAFRGGLGAGKTAFTRGLAKGLGVGGEVASPTFSLVNEYPGKIPLCHFDMYRIHTEDDLYFTGFFDYLESGCILAIEWSENIQDCLPESAISVEIQRVDDNTRKITVNGDDRF